MPAPRNRRPSTTEEGRDARRATDDGERYMRWLEGMWEAHKLDLGYPNAGREEQRTEEVLEMLRGLGELSEELRATEAPSFPPPELGP